MSLSVVPAKAVSSPMSFLIALETHVWVISSHRLLIVKDSTHQAGALYMVAVRGSGTKAVAWLDWYMVRAAMQSSLSIF